MREIHASPIDNGDGLAVGPITIRQDSVIYPRILKALYDSEWGARKDGLDGPRRRLIRDRNRRNTPGGSGRQK